MICVVFEEKKMGDCGSCGSGAGPFAEGRELVEFVCNAHGGAVAGEPLPTPLQTKCQGCGEPFTLETFVDRCPECGGVHAVSPPRCNDPSAIQFAGADFTL
jgi:hypothetical protein